MALAAEFTSAATRAPVSTPGVAWGHISLITTLRKVSRAAKRPDERKPEVSAHKLMHVPDEGNVERFHEPSLTWP